MADNLGSSDGRAKKPGFCDIQVTWMGGGEVGGWGGSITNLDSTESARARPKLFLLGCRSQDSISEANLNHGIHSNVARSK